MTHPVCWDCFIYMRTYRVLWVMFTLKLIIDSHRPMVTQCLPNSLLFLQQKPQYFIRFDKFIQVKEVSTQVEFQL